jgi:hypothetical protein
MKGECRDSKKFVDFSNVERYSPFVLDRKMSQRRLLYLSYALLSFLVGLAAVQLVSVEAPEKQTEPLVVIARFGSARESTAAAAFEPPDDNCGPWSDDVPLRPIISKWLRNEKIKHVPHCSSTLIEATAFNPSNVHPELIDLNDDGIDELVVRYLCSPTGNCAMNIYQRSGKSYRQIFAERQMVNHFTNLDLKHAGFRNLQTRSHGSCCDGGQVTYRFNGKAYKPVACAEYS